MVKVGDKFVVTLNRPYATTLLIGDEVTVIATEAFDGHHIMVMGPGGKNWAFLQEHIDNGTIKFLSSAKENYSFEQKRLKYFIKSAESSSSVNLGPGDVGFLTKLLKSLQ